MKELLAESRAIGYAPLMAEMMILVGGYETDLWLSADASAIFGADDARCHRSPQSKWATNRQDPIAYPNTARVAEFGYGKVAVGVHFQYGQIRFLIRTYQLRCVPRRLSIELHLDLGSSVHDVVVG